MKKGRVVGIDDGFFRRGRDKNAPLIGVIMKGPVVDEIRITTIEVDGSDIYEGFDRILSRFKGIAILYGTIFGGSMVVSLPYFYERYNTPVMAVLDQPPRIERVEKAIKRYNPSFIENLRISFERIGKIYASWYGISKTDVEKVLEMYTISSKIPEPVRIAHLIGRGFRWWI